MKQLPLFEPKQNLLFLAVIFQMSNHWYVRRTKLVDEQIIAVAYLSPTGWDAALGALGSIPSFDSRAAAEKALKAWSGKTEDPTLTLRKAREIIFSIRDKHHLHTTDNFRFYVRCVKTLLHPTKVKRIEIYHEVEL